MKVKTVLGRNIAPGDLFVLLLQDHQRNQALVQMPGSTFIWQEWMIAFSGGLRGGRWTHKRNIEDSKEIGEPLWSAEA